MWADPESSQSWETRRGTLNILMSWGQAKPEHDQVMHFNLCLLQEKKEKCKNCTYLVGCLKTSSENSTLPKSMQGRAVQE